MFHCLAVFTEGPTSHGDNHKACPLCRENVGIDEALTNIGCSHAPSLTQRQVIPQDHVGPDDLITNPDHGLSVRCLDCHSDFYQCDGCGINICSCPFQLDMRDWEGRRFHSPRNPFDEPINEAELEEGEYNYHKSVFYKWKVLLDFMMDDLVWRYLLQTMIEFMKTSSMINLEETTRKVFKIYIDEFRDHMEQLFQDEMSLATIL